MKRLNPVCIHCGRQISKEALARGDGRLLEQEGGARRGEHVVPDCSNKSLKQIRAEHVEQGVLAVVAQG